MYKLPVIKILPKMITRHMNTSQCNVLIEKTGQITTIGINRPSKRNSIDFETVGLIKNALEQFEEDPNSYVAVLYGTGGNFCSGFDLHDLTTNLENNPESALENGLLDISRYVKKPMVAAINGYAVAGGLELALMCDLRVMEETAILGLYGRRFGIPITDGATVRLQAMIGLSRALDLVLTGRSLNAKEAFEWGLANRIVACGTALGQAINLATSLVKFPQECLNVDRNSVYNAAFQNAYDDLLKEEQKNAKQISVKRIIEGAKKFVSGLGKHGKFYDLTERPVCEWEKEFIDTADKKTKSKL